MVLCIMSKKACWQARGLNFMGPRKWFFVFAAFPSPRSIKSALRNEMVHSAYRFFNSHMTITSSAASFLYILEQWPPGESWGMTQTPSVGYHPIWLDPLGPKTSGGRKISGPDQRGSSRQEPGGPEPGHPQESIFWEICWNKKCWACKTGLV